MPVAKHDFLKNRALPAAGARFFKIRGSKLGAKTDQKSIKIRSPRWNASWHRFLMHFGRFWEASWEGKSSQNRLKIDPKKHRKNDQKKRASWRVLGGAYARTRGGPGDPDPPPFPLFKENYSTKEQSTTHSKHPGTPARKRGGGSPY